MGMIHWNNVWSAQATLCSNPDVLGIPDLTGVMTKREVMAQVLEAEQHTIREILGQTAETDDDPHNRGQPYRFPTHKGIHVDYYRFGEWWADSSHETPWNRRMLRSVPQALKGKVSLAIEAAVKARKLKLRQLGVQHEAP
jgi:hypothetical protein